MLVCYYIFFIYCSVALLFIQQLVNYFLVPLPLEGNSLPVQRSCACCFICAYNLACCWAHVVQPTFTPMYLYRSVRRLVWKSWWMQSLILAIDVGVQSTVNCVPACFLIFLQVACFVGKPNSTACLAHMSSFSFFLHVLISSTSSFSIVFLLRMSKYLELVTTTCD